MWAKGIIGWGEFVAANLWGSDELRSGVRENLRRRKQEAISKAMHEAEVLAHQLLTQAETIVKKGREEKAKL